MDQALSMILGSSAMSFSHSQSAASAPRFFLLGPPGWAYEPSTEEPVCGADAPSGGDLSLRRPSCTGILYTGLTKKIF